MVRVFRLRRQVSYFMIGYFRSGTCLILLLVLGAPQSKVDPIIKVAWRQPWN